MAIGLYIHVPFCTRKCNYCDFVSFTLDENHTDSYLINLEKEMAMMSEILTPEEKELETIFLGGGTPTCLNAPQLGNILNAIREYFSWSDDGIPIETTVEANPGTVNVVKLTQLRRGGVNRLSIGVQAFQDRLLSKMGRIHREEDIGKAVRMAREVEFSNLNLDLIYGIPGQTMDNWKESLQRAVYLGPEHIAAYSLKIEEGTPFYDDTLKGVLAPCEEELELDMYLYAIDFLKSQGYHHYEISNFAIPGKESRHNLLYWHHKPYLGLGPGAHSLWRGQRTANPNTLLEYSKKLAAGELPYRVEDLISKELAMSETMFLGLRLIEGVDLTAFAQRFGVEAREVYGEAIASLLEKNLVALDNGFLRLTSRGLPITNQVFEAFV